MSAPHTPGPWIQVCPNEASRRVLDCVGPAEDDGRGLVADCENFKRDPRECAANATLIATAPDFVAACRCAGPLVTSPMTHRARKRSLLIERACYLLALFSLFGIIVALIVARGGLR